jgi:FtsP/CotA-like multicopper oxidase with cupredoxin domain
MNNKALIKRFRELILILITLTLMTGTPVAAMDVYLVAREFSKTMPDNAVITMWGFARASNADCPATAIVEGPSVPGPRITVLPSETTLNIHVCNELDAESISIVIPGQITSMTSAFFTDNQGRQRVRSFTQETAPNNGTGTYTWSNFKPGTYVYHSGTHPAVQVQMGLYGAVTKDVATGTPYPNISYDNEVMLFFSEIDPALHTAVANNDYGPGKGMTSTIDYDPKYFLINGAPFPATPPLPAGNTGGTTLIRFFNMGLETHVPVLQGLYVRVIAEDGNLYSYPKEQYSVELFAAKTRDAIITPTANGNYAIYDRRLNLTNAAASAGGMLTYLQIGQPPPPPVDNDGDGFTVAAGDCNDNNPAIYPGAPEIMNDAIDQDCNGQDVTVTITKAKYQPNKNPAKSNLIVEAASNLNQNAALIVSALGGVSTNISMTWDAGKQRWKTNIKNIPNPGSVTVKSSNSNILGSVSQQTTVK